MFKNPFSFNGRIRRTEYGISYVLHIFFIYLFAFLMESLNLGGYQVLIILAASYWFVFSQGAKRCHDLGNNGFYQLIPFYVFALIFSEGQRRNNKYGQDPKLMELRSAEQSLAPAPPKQPLKLTLPEGKSMEAIGSELLSGIMGTALAVAVLSFCIGTEDWVYFTIESILIMAGYFTVLLLSFNRNPLPHLPLYFIVHRAIFSVGWYVVVWTYEIVSNNITDFNFAAIGGDITYIIATFILTYIPYFFYKTQKHPNLLPLEA
ncbi:MAG: DUF805 domain-containing protein [Aequorivita sp.]|nr:DUF805 domain-containing protein [Aequorivita sp.]